MLFGQMQLLHLASHRGDIMYVSPSITYSQMLIIQQFNATFPNTQFFPNAGVFHASELWITFGTYEPTNVTTQELALSNYMRGAWARFAKDPVAGPGWNAVGTGSGYFGGAGDLDLGLIGSDGNAGVKVIKQRDVDHRCPLWTPILTAGI